MGEQQNRSPSIMLWNSEQQMRGPTYAKAGKGGLWFIHDGMTCICAGTELQMRAEIERIHKGHAQSIAAPIWC